ncbi:hypothetical protein GW7_10939, partial [Heterocephalus glaber]
FYFLFILRQDFTKSLSCPGWVQTCHSPASASQRAGITGMHHHAWLRLFSYGNCFGGVGPHYVAQAGLELLGSRNSPASASQAAGITVLWFCTK